MAIPEEGIYRVGGLRGGRPEVRVGASDPSLTSVSGMAAVTELVERLDVISALDAVVGPIKQRDHTGVGVVLDHRPLGRRAGSTIHSGRRWGTGVARVTQRMLERLPATRRTRVVSPGGSISMPVT